MTGLDVCAHRRRSVQYLGALALGGLTLPSPRWAQAQTGLPPFDPFGLGVASGSPSSQGVVLWTRLLAPEGSQELEPRPYRVDWEIAEDEGFSRRRRAGQTHALAELAHAVHVEVDGLDPGRWYHYRFRLGDALSPAGRTRTLPAPDEDVASLRLAYASCQRWEHGFFHAWGHLRDERPDLVVFLGDYIYEYASPRTALRAVPGGRVRSLAAYRRRYAHYRSDPLLQAAHAACPWLMVWDDHEVENDYAGAHGGQGEPDFPGGSLARRSAAYQAYFEHMPLRTSVLSGALKGLLSGADFRLHARLQWGRLVDMMLLDDRQYRDLQACTPSARGGSAWVDASRCEERKDPRRSLLGGAQEAWLDGSLQAARARWTVIAQQTLFSPRVEIGGSTQRVWNDGWDGYPAARSRLLDGLQRHRPANPVFLGGDVHQNWVGHVHAQAVDPKPVPVGVEFCGTSLTSLTSDADLARARLAANPHFVFAEATHRGYGLAQFSRDALRVDLRTVDARVALDPGVQTLASFRVPAGRPLVERL